MSQSLIHTTLVNSQTEMNKFSFPQEFDPRSMTGGENKICVVSVIGKSPLNALTSKASILKSMLDKDIFKGISKTLGFLTDKGDIEGYYDVENQVIYLHHCSMFDVQKLAAQCDRSTQDFFLLWQTEEFEHAKALLMLFLVSHIVLLSNPGSCFDITYVRLFRILDMIRLKLQHSISELLQGVVGKDWYLAGRPCSPRVLFVFESCSVDINDEGDYNKTRSQKVPPIKRLQHSIEDQIYRILRKSRIITNISNNSLFAVPANQEFVYIHGAKTEIPDPVLFYLQQLRNNSAVFKDSDVSRSRSYQVNRRTHQPGSPSSLQQSGSERIHQPGSPSSLQQSGSENSFKHFLSQHIELAFSKGFNDNVGRHSVPALFEMPTCSNWWLAATKLYNFMFADGWDGRTQPHFNTFKSMLETETRFSENRCNKVLPIAESAYQEGLPTHYVTSYHVSKLDQACHVFHQFARGPACQKYISQLKESCVKYWKTGRQLCEQSSLTAVHCVNPLHRTADEPETEENQHLPVMSHSSQVKTKSACNCGRKQADNDDPFHHKTANFDFYDSLEVLCCKSLQHIDFPAFRPSTDESRPGQIPDVIVTSKSTPNAPAVKSDIVSAMTSLSLATLSLGQSGGCDLYGHQDQISLNPEQECEDQLNARASPEFSPVCTRQHSTTEYLPGMIHTESPPGLLPKFSSWSLCCLGKASLYNHSQGLDQPGFLHGSNFLLPWEFSIRAEKDKWPSVGETAGKKGKQKRGTKASDLGEVNVRIYLGEEYECPRGHRFFCSGPEKIIKVSSNSTVKDNATRLVNMDMPLYCPCHCRTSKGYLAQLMRIFVVTPDAPIKVKLHPRVQPAPAPAPFYQPSHEMPIELPSDGVWVLRFPSVYLGDHHVYTMPSDPQQIPACRLLKGVFSYNEVTSEG